MTKNYKEFWVPEDFVYKYASDCLLAHPEQAAQLMRDDSVKVAADKLAEAVKQVTDNSVISSIAIGQTIDFLKQALSEYRGK